MSIICENCRSYISEESYNIHLIRCRKYSFYCETCADLFPINMKQTHVCQSQYLNRDLNNDSVPNLILKCDMCGVDHPSMESHVCQVTCQYCYENIVLEFLQDHIITCYHASKTVECDECHRRIEMRVLDSHLREHRLGLLEPKESEYLSAYMTKDCPDCGEEFMDHDEWTAHRMEVHSWDPEVYPCSHCELIFISAQDLELHRRYQLVME